MNPLPETTNIVESLKPKLTAKRIASPITPSLKQANSKRKITCNPDPIMWKIDYEQWKLEKQIKHNKEIREFRELELKFQSEE